MTEPVISKLVDLSISPWSIQRTKQGILWICGGTYGDPLTKIDIDGSKSTLTLDTYIDDICVDPVTDQVYCAPRELDTGIRTVDVHSGKTAQLFTTKAQPYCLNVTTDGNTFIVSTWDKKEVTLYDRKGAILHTLTTVEGPEHITICRYTGNVAISCGSGGVMVMENKDDSVDHIYTYPTNGTIIEAYDAEFDDAGHLLVADRNNTAVHIVDATTGNTLKMIKIDGMPICLTTQQNGDIVLGTIRQKQLLTMEYSS